MQNSDNLIRAAFLGGWFWIWGLHAAISPTSGLLLPLLACNSQRCKNGDVWETVVCPLPKTGILTKTAKMTSLHSAHKCNDVVLRAPKTAQMAGVIQAKPWFIESGVLTTPPKFGRNRRISLRSGTGMTGRPDRTMEMSGESTASYLVCTPCVPVFWLVLIGLEAKGLLDFLGRRGITRSRCAVEPSPSHMWHR